MDIISTIINRLNQKASETGLFESVYGLCDIYKDPKDKNKTGFSYYNGNGQAKVVTNFDNSNGTLFWLKRGSIAVNSNVPENFRTTSCDNMLSFVLPLRGVAVVRKSDLPCDNATAADQVAQSLIKALLGNDNQAKAQLKAVRYEVTSAGYSTNLKEITTDLKWCNLYFDISVSFIANKDCLPSICSNEIPSFPCDFSITLSNSNGEIIYTVTQESENPFLLESQPIVDGNGVSINIPYDPNTPYVTTPCSVTCNPASVSINTVAYDAVVSGGSLNVIVKYENGSDVGTKIGSVWTIPNPVTCSPCTVNVNGNFFNTIATGGTLDILVEYVSGGSIGTISGGKVLIPDPAGCPDATAVLKDTAGVTISTTPIASGGSANITAPDGSIMVNSTAFDSVLSGGTKNVVVKDAAGASVGSKVGSEWIVPTAEKILVTRVQFDTGATLLYLITIDADTAGTYNTAAFSGGMASATYKKNGGAVTLPFSVVATDTLEITPNAVGVIKLTGTYV